jgi:hypothetical protein
MAKTIYYDTGDLVPNPQNYSTFCDNAVRYLSGGYFPACPTCGLAASWRKVGGSVPEETALQNTASKTARRKA